MRKLANGFVAALGAVFISAALFTSTAQNAQAQEILASVGTTTILDEACQATLNVAANQYKWVRYLEVSLGTHTGAIQEMRDRIQNSKSNRNSKVWNLAILEKVADNVSPKAIWKKCYKGPGVAGELISKSARDKIFASRK